MTTIGRERYRANGAGTVLRSVDSAAVRPDIHGIVSFTRPAWPSTSSHFRVTRLATATARSGIPADFRRHVSNGNPYSEAQFKTLKYRSAFPARFPSVEAARAHCQEFFPWYNNEHRHGGPRLHTAADIHHGHAPAVQAARVQVGMSTSSASPRARMGRGPHSRSAAS
jgi:Integrase core domain